MVTVRVVQVAKNKYAYNGASTDTIGEVIICLLPHLDRRFCNSGDKIGQFKANDPWPQ